MMTRPGFEERAKGSANLQEILKWLPSDLFRTCLARVCTHKFCPPAPSSIHAKRGCCTVAYMQMPVLLLICLLQAWVVNPCLRL